MKLYIRIISMLLCFTMLFLTGCQSEKSAKKTTSKTKPGGETSSVTSDKEEPNSTETQSPADTDEPIIEENQPLLQGSVLLNLQPLPGDRSIEMVGNPDRGFRLETYFTVKSETAYPNGDQDAYSFFDALYYDYYEEMPQLTQAFFYITDYYNKDFDEAAFEKMDKYFEFMREKRIRLLIRFVYQWDENDRVSGPTAEQVKRHIKQLAPVIERNKDVIHCWQAGFLGNWGEWHNLIVPMTNEEKGDILKLLVDSSPEKMFIQTRMVEYRETVADSAPQKKYIGYHDDYLTGFAQRWSCGLTEDTPDYEKMLNQSSNLLIDGEMPWGNDKMMGDKFNGLKMAEYLSKRHFTSMSLIHNYRENGPCSMSFWQQQYVNASTLLSKGLLVAPGWYSDSNGETMRQTIFSYIQQYLGYYMVASESRVRTTAKQVEASFSVTNYGFSAPHAMDKMELVLLDSDNNVVASQDCGKMETFQPGKKIRISGVFALPSVTESYSIGIRFVNSAGIGARFGNDILFENDINILGRVR